MKILLDENLPQKLVTAVRVEGHVVKSVVTLRMQALDSARFRLFARQNFVI